MNRSLRIQKSFVVAILVAMIVFVWGRSDVSGPSPASSASKPIGAAVSAAADPKRWEQVYAKLPMSFEANRGQSDPAVQFLSRGHGYSVFLTSAEAVVVLSKTQRRQDAASHSTALRMRLRGAVNEQP